ncbi:MAG: response regulator transcription factor [Proteobacteria bacterium]|nr:response regulator transcription factor [Pseudomonadota bacterium]
MSNLRIKVLVSCSSSIASHGIGDLLSKESSFELINKAINVTETIYWAEKGEPDIVLLCSQVLIENGPHFLSKIREKAKKEIKFVMINSNFTPRQERQMVKEGIVGILGSNDPIQSLGKALKAVYSGDVWLSRKLIPLLVGNSRSDMDPIALTKRELEVLSLLAAGKYNREISTKLCITIDTVKTHVNNIYKKLEIKNRMQATFYAIKHNLVSK